MGRKRLRHEFIHRALSVRALRAKKNIRTGGIKAVRGQESNVSVLEALRVMDLPIRDYWQ
jgi:hypothetical protein